MNVTMNADLSATTVHPVVEGSLYAIGGSIDAGQNLSWLPRGLEGRIPVQGYLLRNDDQALLIDTGLVVHADAIRDALDTLIGKRALEVTMTRREMDTIMNLPWILKRYDVKKVHFSGDISPIDFFDVLEEVAAEVQARTFTDVALNWLRPGLSIDYAGTRLDVVRPSVRVLATQWLHEPKTRTLFTSDFLGFLPTDQEGPYSIGAEVAEITVDQIVAHYGRKFDWLRGINPAPVMADLRRVMTDFPSDRLCPAYGPTIEGAENVRQIWDKAIAAVEAIGNQPRESVTEDFKGIASGRKIA
ncbi:hypothetical protein [Celeribacter indicus]|uniref:Metallo-beta-lactamase domain-containing protein n=1 Tax=Celeribacter indicus TaxID=1208324 RepID=A0A0B5E061_9RHOB|nr:hypothetical protein [Celeribacter indicus]AJE46780.1 hypothetical protein P73_2065 [Celeribacter indicus]SDX06220.1 Glyoxylase, beta-lactamase superfamily II [Celeribacter indicus]